MICSSCMKEIDDGTIFCPSCGSNLLLRRPYNMRFDLLREDLTRTQSMLVELIPHSILIKVTGYCNTDTQSNILGNDLNSATLQYLTITYNLYIRGSIYESYGKELVIQIFQPDGTLMKGAESPSEGTMKVIIGGKENRVGYGSDVERIFQRGWHGVFFLYRGLCVGKDLVFIQ